MEPIKHVVIEKGDYGWIDTSKCPCDDTFKHYLWMAAPEIEWYYVEPVGSYQGEVYAIGKYKEQWFVMKDYYGSCSGCGAWGEGGEPTSLEGVLKNGELFDEKPKALEFVKKTWANEDAYEKPTSEFMKILEI